MENIYQKYASMANEKGYTPRDKLLERVLEAREIMSKVSKNLEQKAKTNRNS